MDGVDHAPAADAAGAFLIPGVAPDEVDRRDEMALDALVMRGGRDDELPY